MTAAIATLTTRPVAASPVKPGAGTADAGAAGFASVLADTVGADPRAGASAGTGEPQTEAPAESVPVSGAPGLVDQVATLIGRTVVAPTVDASGDPAATAPGSETESEADVDADGDPAAGGSTVGSGVPLAVASVPVVPVTVAAAPSTRAEAGVSADTGTAAEASAPADPGPGAIDAASLPDPGSSTSTSASPSPAPTDAPGRPASVVPTAAPPPVAASPLTASAPPTASVAGVASGSAPVAGTVSAAAISGAITGAASSRPVIASGDATAPAVSAPAPDAANSAVPTVAPAPQPAPAASVPSASVHTTAPNVPTLTTQVAGPLFRLASAPHGEHVMTLTVTPDDLGPVTVRAHVTGEGMRVELFAANDTGRDALRSILADLRRDLAGSGVSAGLDLSDHDRPQRDAREQQAADRRLPSPLASTEAAVIHPAVRSWASTSTIDLFA